MFSFSSRPASSTGSTRSNARRRTRRRTRNTATSARRPNTGNRHSSTAAVNNAMTANDLLIAAYLAGRIQRLPSRPLHTSRQWVDGRGRIINHNKPSTTFRVKLPPRPKSTKFRVRLPPLQKKPSTTFRVKLPGGAR